MARHCQVISWRSTSLTRRVEGTPPGSAARLAPGPPVAWRKEQIAQCGEAVEGDGVIPPDRQGTLPLSGSGHGAPGVSSAVRVVRSARGLPGSGPATGSTARRPGGVRPPAPAPRALGCPPCGAPRPLSPARLTCERRGWYVRAGSWRSPRMQTRSVVEITSPSCPRVLPRAGRLAPPPAGAGARSSHGSPQAPRPPHEAR